MGYEGKHERRNVCTENWVGQAENGSHLKGEKKEGKTRKAKGFIGLSICLEAIDRRIALYGKMV